MAHIICGVDVSAETLDARIGRDGVWQQFARTSEGIAQLACFCKTHEVNLVVMEATGGYERLPFAQLWAADMAVAIVNPRSVHQFAQAMGALEKYETLRAAGKPAKVVRIALARKLLVRLNTKARDVRKALAQPV